jgi:hypothetical protein
LQLHHLYRAMAWLDEEIAPADALAPRCIKDLIEERLFERRFSRPPASPSRPICTKLPPDHSAPCPA